MICEQVRLDLAAYLHGDLPDEVRRDIAAHLSACRMCAEEASALRRLCHSVSDGLRKWVDEGECPPEVAEQIRLLLLAEQEADRREARAAWFRTTFTVAAGVAVAVLVVLTTPIAGMLRQASLSLPYLARTVRDGAGVPVGQTLAVHGVEVALEQVRFTADRTIVHFTVAGAADISVQELESVQLLAGESPLALVGSPMFRPVAGGQVRITATFGAAPAGTPLQLRIERLGGVRGPWAFTLPQRR